MPWRMHFSDSWMQRSIISNEKVSYLYLGVLSENRWMSFLHSISHYSLRKSLKDLSDHLNVFVFCQGRSQLSLAIFRAFRNHLVASKQSYMLKLSKSGRHEGSVTPNLTHDLIYSTPPKDDDVLPENKDGHRLEIFGEKIFMSWKNIFICGFQP